MGYNCYMHLVARGFDVPDRMPDLPPARDFVLSAGFGGVAALLAALLIAVIAFFVARGVTRRQRVSLEQQGRQHREVREQQQRAAAIDRCWQRLVWVVETAGLEPASETATLGLGPELAVEILRGLVRDAEQLSDGTLANAVTVHLNQFSLVLAQQAGPLTELTASPAAAAPLPAQDPAPRTPPSASSAPTAEASTATTATEDSTHRAPSTGDDASADTGADPAQRRASTPDGPAQGGAQKATATRTRRRAR